jgi:PTS system nitrogen regulatory IIA component
MDEVSFGSLIQKGGILYGVAGNTPKEVLYNVIQPLSLPDSLTSERLLQAVLEREGLMPTSIGGGIALPHPRNPLLVEAGGQFAVIAFLQKPVDWMALDGVPVRTVILLVSSSARAHLHSLSRVHFICRQDNFNVLLAEQAPKERIMEAIARIEKVWK